MTAALMAIALEEGILGSNVQWDSTLRDVLPPDLMPTNNSHYMDVTLEQLLGMQSCIPGNPPNAGWWVYPRSGKSLFEQRADAARDALMSTPTKQPGTAYCYSNWAYVLAGAILEAVTGILWEDMIRNFIFEPILGSKDAVTTHVAFGPPDGESDPWGHLGKTRSDLIPCSPFDTTSNPSACDNPAVMGPAGTFSGTGYAMAAYLSWHVRCHNGFDNIGLLSQESCQQLHTPVDSSISNYALGWTCASRSWAAGSNGELACNHLGSNNLWYHDMWIAPGIDRAFVASTNSARRSGGESDLSMVDATVAMLIQKTADPSIVCTNIELGSSDAPTVAPTDAPTVAPTYVKTNEPTSVATSNTTSSPSQQGSTTDSPSIGQNLTEPPIIQGSTTDSPSQGLTDIPTNTDSLPTQVPTSRTTRSKSFSDSTSSICWVSLVLCFKMLLFFSTCLP